MAEHAPHNVLVVDDEEFILTLIDRQLDGLPCTVIPTSSSAEAIHILKTREIAVLLCDMNMPGLDGNVVLTTARDTNPNIISVLITGASDHSATIRAINEGGISKYIAKPWRQEELLATVIDSLHRYDTLCRQQNQLELLANDLETRPDAETKIYEDVDKPPERITPLRERGGERQARARKDLVSDRYELGEILGQGGMGTVFKAEDLLLSMPVAIKILHPRLTRDSDAIQTLKEEARIAMQLSHRHIVRLHNLQESRGNYFLVMEYVEGRTFRDIINLYEKLPLDTVLQVVRVCSEALAYAHRHGVLHKDLKPGNLLLDKDGVLKVIDFGLASLAGRPDDTHYVAGTPVYMSPEQVHGEELDARTDVYSLGVIVYELIAGRPPFPLDTTDLHIVSKGIKDFSGLPEEMAPVLRKATARNREERYASVEEFSGALQEAPSMIFMSRHATEAG